MGPRGRPRIAVAIYDRDENRDRSRNREEKTARTAIMKTATIKISKILENKKAILYAG